jgi:RNA polymerase sigma-70 factor (ECF subfamily)
MKGLSGDQQVLIALVCVDGLSYREAAEVLRLPIGTVMSRLARARQALAAALGDDAERLSEGQAMERPRG